LEKMLYVVWKNEADSDEGFRQRLVEELSPQLVALGARRLRIGVVDEDVIPAAPLRTETTRPPISGLVSIWVDTSVRRRPMEDAIQASVSRLAGYLVTESEPIVNTKHVVAEGGRTPGMYQVVLLRRPPRLSHEQWLDIWLGSHTQVAIDTQSTFGYRQNVIVRPLTYAAPAYDAIIEELFPAEAMADPMVFYDAAGDEVRRKRHEKAMLESVVRFIDFDKMDRIPMSEYIVKS
jgi:hypothetical protein